MIAQEEAQSRSVPHVSFYDPNFDLTVSSASASLEAEEKAKNIELFFRILALCHDTIPERVDGEIKLSASNPDDEALVCAASYFGYEFKDREEKYAILRNVHSKSVERIEVLETIAFTSTRKRMSVIIKDIDGQIKMLIKGLKEYFIQLLKRSFVHFIFRGGQYNDSKAHKWTGRNTC